MGKWYVNHAKTGELLIDQTFHTWKDAKDAAKRLFK